MFKINGLELSYDGSRLIIRRSTKAQLWRIAFAIVSTAILLFIFLQRSPEMRNNLNFLHLFILAAIVIQLYAPVRALILKEYFVFDQSSQTIFRKEDAKANFNEVNFIEIEVIYSDGSNEYKLLIRLKDKSAIEIEKSTKEAEIRRVAGEIATFIDKPVKQT
jgi:hypothetical protein